MLCFHPDHHIPAYAKFMGNIYTAINNAQDNGKFKGNKFGEELKTIVFQKRKAFDDKFRCNDFKDEINNLWRIREQMRAKNSYDLSSEQMPFWDNNYHGEPTGVKDEEAYDKNSSCQDENDKKKTTTGNI